MSSMADDGERLELLDGDLDLTIHEARGLPNMDILSTILRRLCICRPRRLPSRDVDADTDADSPLRRRRRQKPLGRHSIVPTSDPYAVVAVSGPGGPDTTVARTYVVRNSEAPDWSARIRIPLAHEASRLVIQVRDSDPFGSDLIGAASLRAADLLDGEPMVGAWLQLLRPDSRGPPKPTSAIRVSLTFIPASASSSRRRHFGGVPAYFPARRGCELRLYQDAHVPVGAPCSYERGRCWEDVCMAVLGAQKLVYVAGWAVSARVRLLREEMSPEMAEKAAEVRALAGVEVEKRLTFAKA